MNLIAQLALRLEQMTVRGDDHVGWSARFTRDPNWCLAAKRETAIFGCSQRRDEVLAGTLIRGSSGYWQR